MVMEKDLRGFSSDRKASSSTGGVSEAKLNREPASCVEVLRGCAQGSVVDNFSPDPAIQALREFAQQRAEQFNIKLSVPNVSPAIPRDLILN